MPKRDEALSRLKGAPWLPSLAPFFGALDGEAGKTRAVGGIVRDTLLGIERAATDFDLATQLRPDEVMARAERAGFAARPTGFDHGTVTLAANGVIAEVTTLRQDVETFGRHASVRFGTDWTADARRRDFTMNALYGGPSGELHDPLGGLEDCLARRVRFIGDADQRIAEDRLRVYRYFRFSASHGGQRFEDDAVAACARAVDGLGALSAERVGSEMTRLLDLPRCAETLERMRDIEVVDKRAFSDDVIAALQRLETFRVPLRANMRLSIVQAMTQLAERFRTLWRLPNRDMMEIGHLSQATLLARQERWTELAYRFPAISHDAIVIAAAIDKKTLSWIKETSDFVARTSGITFPISGEDLLALGFSGPNLGETLRRLETIWLQAGGGLDKQTLLLHLTK